MTNVVSCLDVALDEGSQLILWVAVDGEAGGRRRRPEETKEVLQRQEDVFWVQLGKEKRDKSKK